MSPRRGRSRLRRGRCSRRAGTSSWSSRFAGTEPGTRCAAHNINTLWSLITAVLGQEWFIPDPADKQDKVFSTSFSILPIFSIVSETPLWESISAVCIPLLSQYPRCASLREVNLRGVHPTGKCRPKNTYSLMQTLRCESHRGVKIEIFACLWLLLKGHSFYCHELKIQNNWAKSWSKP